MTALLKALALLACVLQCTRADVCVESIDINSGSILYLDGNEDSFTQDVAHFMDEISTETMVVLFTITVPSSENGNESRKYELSKTHLCYYASPELVDLMTFNALKLVDRTLQISLDVRTFTTCGNKSWEKIFHDAFALNEEDGFVRLLQESNQTYRDEAISSGLLVYMSLSVTALFATFVVILPIVRATQANTACTITLTTTVLYPFSFLLLALVEDFSTAFSSLLIQATVLICINTFEYYRIARSTKQFCKLWCMLSLIAVVPFLYTLTIIGSKDLFNAGYVYITTKFWLAVVLFATIITWIFCFFMLVAAFKPKHTTRRRASSKNNSRDSTDPEKGLLAASKVPARSGSVSQQFVIPPLTTKCSCLGKTGPNVIV